MSREIRIASLLWLSLAAPLAGADEAAPDPRALGVAESALRYCAPLDPVAANQLRKRIKELEHGASQQQLTQVRRSDEYRKAFGSVVDFTGKVDPRNARLFCAQASVARK